MNAIDAVRLMVKHYPGGVEALAAQCGKSPETLRKELADAAGYKFGLADTDVINEACIRANSPHCHSLMNVIACNTGGFVQLEVREMGAGDIYRDVAKLLKECSDVNTAVAEAMRDGVISQNEVKAIERELRELLEQIQVVSADVEAESSRPATLRRA